MEEERNIKVTLEQAMNMHFEPEPPTEIVLRKYNITEEEYYSICDELENKLHVGRCGWCV
nr:MAG: hypothetical protein [Bacteriophage sp.]